PSICRRNARGLRPRALTGSNGSSTAQATSLRSCRSASPTTPDHAETPGHDHNLKQALGRLPGLLGVGDGAAVVLGPVGERLDRPDERGPELGQAVFDAACRPG